MLESQYLTISTKRDFKCQSLFYSYLKSNNSILPCELKEWVISLRIKDVPYFNNIYICVGDEK